MTCLECDGRGYINDGSASWWTTGERAELMITFTVHGIPVTQGSKRAFVNKGRAIVTETGGARHKDWRARVAYAAQQTMGDEPLVVPHPLTTPAVPEPSPTIVPTEPVEVPV